MAAREPSWWYRETSWQQHLLAPAAAAYRHIVEGRYRRAAPYRSPLPVVCVGNFTVGGTGKTPTSLLIADLVEEAGGAPWFLSRGYGGRLDGQEQVDPDRHTAAEVGDEPLLLAARAPTVTSRNRALGAEFIARRAPANAVIVMDDGLQNPSLHKDLSIALVDGRRGIGNGRVIPAGPLRAGLGFQLQLADVVLFTGADTAHAEQQLAAFPDSRRVPSLLGAAQAAGDTRWLKGARVAAFAGIANPDRFFALLEDLGAEVVQRTAFADHATLSEAEAQALLDAAAVHGATPITTEKDFVRLAGLDGARARIRAEVRTLPIRFQLKDDGRARMLDLIAKMIAGHGMRSR